MKQIGIDIEPDKQFRFNNDALYYRFGSFKTEEEQLKATYWRNRIANFDNLRDFMHQQRLEPAVQMENTRKVLGARQIIEDASF